MKTKIVFSIYVSVILITMTMMPADLLSAGKKVAKAGSALWTYGQPFAVDNPVKGSSYQAIVSHFPVEGNIMFSNLKKPYPTNNWFINLCLGKGEAGSTIDPYQPEPDKIGWASVYPYPYTINVNDPTSPSPRKSLGVGCWPYNVKLYSAVDPKYNQPFYAVIYDAAPHKFIGCTEEVNMCTLKSYDDFSATLLWQQIGGSGTMEAPIVRGMPYVTMVYKGLTPSITKFSPAIIAVNGKPIGEVQTFKADSNTIATLTLAGAAQPPIGPSTWVLYASAPITFNCTVNGFTAVTKSGGYDCFVRLAYVTTKGNDPNYKDKDKRITILKACGPYYPTGGTFSASISSETPNQATTTFTWKTNKTPPANTFCMYALPHQMDLLPVSSLNLLEVNVMKGPMKGVYGTTWTMTQNLIDFAWNGPKNLSNTSEANCDNLYNTLVDDNTILCTGTSYSYANTCKSDTYYGGKEMAKWGHMAIIADELADLYNTGGKYPDPVKYEKCIKIAKNIRTRLKSFLQPWLDGTKLPWVHPKARQDYLRYDTKIGGIIDQNDYDKVGANFLNSLYTDHHFHYGYFLYAAAAIAKGDSAWVTQYDSKVKALARDIANPAADPYFPRNRYHDWYDGNSWADGLVGDGAGRNQESTSEACNAWYGLYLYGLASGDDNMKNTGRLLLASEIRSAQKYWQILADSSYPKFYTDQYKVVGILYSSQILSKNFFGVEPRYSYGIQAIPNTPVNQVLLQQSWIDEICTSGIISQLVVDPPANPLTGPPLERDEMPWATVNLVIQDRNQNSKALTYYQKYLSKYIWWSQGTQNQYAVNYDDGTCRTILLRDIYVTAGN
jgi:endo-1,3(4)-beta-glucanase